MTKRSGVDGPSPAADLSRADGASTGASLHPGPASRLYVGDDASMVPATAQEVLDGLHDGRLGLDTPIRISRDREPGPLRAFLRDLVFLAHQEQRARMGWQRLDEDAFAKVFRGAAVGFAIADLSGRLVEANPALCALLGRDEAALVGSLVGDLSDPEDRAAEVRLANQMFAGRRVQYVLEKRFIHSSGARIPCRVHVSMVRDASGAPESVIATVLDRRPEIELEDLRARAKEARSIRTMAERLAHDFGNALSVVQLESVLSGEALETGEDVRTHLQAVQEAAGICSRLVSQLRQLSATGVPSTSRIDIGEELRVNQAAFRGLVGGERHFEMRVPSGHAEVALNRTSLDRILLNVLSNAAHHTPPGGSVSVSVDASPDWVRMQIEDTGVGMPESVRARALEPFYTARAEGSGLGLAIVNGLVSSAGGSVAISSFEGRGTTVEIRLPRLEPRVQGPEDRGAG